METLVGTVSSHRGVGYMRQRIVDLLDFLPVLYPGGSDWLARRLDDVVRGDASCVVLERDTEVIGVAIGVIKSESRFKICTLYVRPSARRLGGGSALLAEVLEVAKASGAKHAYITAAHTVSNELWSVLRPSGFRQIVTQLDRYGHGRHETVFIKDL